MTTKVLEEQHQDSHVNKHGHSNKRRKRWRRKTTTLDIGIIHRRSSDPQHSICKDSKHDSTATAATNKTTQTNKQTNNQSDQTKQSDQTNKATKQTKQQEQQQQHLLLLLPVLLLLVATTTQQSWLHYNNQVNGKHAVSLCMVISSCMKHDEQH